MKAIIAFLICLLLLGCASNAPVDPALEPGLPPTEDSLTEDIEDPIEPEGELKMKLRSTAFAEGESIPEKYTCQGENINPQLIIEDIPRNAKSLALIIDDPDAPAGTWVHWLVKDISANKNIIQENTIPGTQVANDFGKPDYGGPCPPSGTHRYFFKLYALDIDTFEANSKTEFYSKVDEHKIDEAVLMGKYSKE